MDDGICVTIIITRVKNIEILNSAFYIRSVDLDEPVRQGEGLGIRSC